MAPTLWRCSLSLTQVVAIVLFIDCQLRSVSASPKPKSSLIGTGDQELHSELGYSAASSNVCRNERFLPFDYSVKPRGDLQGPICVADVLRPRQLADNDYSCSQTKPCPNGACCSKKAGYCNYGPDACGTNGQSPNEVCWSNCDAHAECGRYAKRPGAKCPLNVCCSEFGFCGMTEEFCSKKNDEKSGGCQSNCDQPGSGASGGDVQSRVIGYYEAWAHNRRCSGMDLRDIPVESLTHLYFSFGYISPGDFNIVPMDNLPASLFSDFTSLKKTNNGLKAVIALGGWTFNDNGTASQPVFSNMVSSRPNRANFIINLLSFLREFAFDGVDFDWEYPGAGDRGGVEGDGILFTQFLKELREAIEKEPIKYSVSFTIPTSYWYLRHFDLKAVDHVDFVNVMSYDLHGVWDSTNPIGSHIYAHTNLTEIKSAMDLLWRNQIPPEKLNLGLGFYGRSFQFSNPSCHQPGCNFKGGATPGPCTKNSGTLSYREINDIIDEKKLKPYHDEKNAVKYIVWGNDQWVSYDDEETFTAKIKFANGLGLGGLLIWAIDLDTPDLKALNAVLAPKSVKKFARQADHASYWQDVTAQDCYVSDCGKGCDAGFIKITHQPCGGAKPVTRRAKKADSSLCCPISAAPDPKKCVWRGNWPECNGHCQNGEVAVQLNKWGNGNYCEHGKKAYCCEVPEGKQTQCYWTDMGDNCKSGDELMTFRSNLLEIPADKGKTFEGLVGKDLVEALKGINKQLYSGYCCPAKEAKRWKNCAWHGKPGQCNDNHCDIGHQVQLTQSNSGQGQSCSPRVERTRVFCCDAADGESPFLPVPLDHLFPNPPKGDDVDIDFDIQVDSTWGVSRAGEQAEDPNKATFGFVVMTSPEELQISLDKRDGSHWELFNCNLQDDEEEQTIQMVCTDTSGNSNCGKISLGHGVPGTILEMPKGCIKNRYVVAKDMTISSNQILPAHLTKRNFVSRPVVYDLTFDYEWLRVPRDLGDTQLRVDYSNEVGYWDNIVAKAGDSKRKRSLADVGGSHRRWLEEEWREDAHLSGLNKRDLQARWFGSDIIDWLKGLINTNIKPEFTHDIDQSFTAILLRERWTCKTNEVDLSAKLDVSATANVRVATSFGLTIITTLGRGLSLDLSQSYLYFKNKGDVSAVFTFDAVGKAVFSSGDFKIAGLDNFPGATFSIPKLLTVGPNFVLNAAVDAEITLAGHFESRVDITSWEIRQTYPDHDSDWDPKTLDKPSRDGTGLEGVKQPTFDFSVTANGEISAHLKPTFEFGIVFDKQWKVDSAKVDVFADGWVRLKAAAGISSGENCPFTYGIDVGAELYARAEAPSTFGWRPRSFPIASVSPKSVKKGGTCPVASQRLVRRTEREAIFEYTSLDDVGYTHNTSHQLVRRDTVVGPFFSLKGTNRLCPNPKSGSSKCSEIEGWEPGQNDESVVTLFKKSLLGASAEHALQKRAPKIQDFCKGSAKMSVKSPDYDSSGSYVKRFPNVATYGPKDPQNCNDFDFGEVATPSGADTSNFATEHILEYQLLPIFLNAMNIIYGRSYRKNPLSDQPDHVDFCKYMKPYWQPGGRFWFTLQGETTKKDPLGWAGSAFPGKDNAYENELVLLHKNMNGAKARFWSDSAINDDSKMVGYIQNNADRAIKNIKEVLMAYRYHQVPVIGTSWQKQVNRVGDLLEKMDAEIPKHVKPNGYDVYQSMNLKPRWNTWISGRVIQARKKPEQYMENWIGRLKEAYITETPSTNPDDVVLVEKIKKLDEAIDEARKISWTVGMTFVNPIRS